MPAGASMEISSKIGAIAQFVQRDLPGSLDLMADDLLKALLFLAIALGAAICIYYLITSLLNNGGDISEWMAFPVP